MKIENKILFKKYAIKKFKDIIYFYENKAIIYFEANIALFP